MKQNKTTFPLSVLVLTIALFTALSLTGCDNGNENNNGNNNPKDNPKDQSTPISGLFGGNYSATVKGHFTDTQWNGVPDKVKSLLEAGYNATPGMGQGGLKTYFENNAVVIIVQSDPVGYTKYKVVSTEPATIYFNLGALDILTGDDIAGAYAYMRTGTNGSADTPHQTAITFRDKTITVDYSGSGLTQAQADTVTPKLQGVFTNLENIDPNMSEGIKLATMVNRTGFKIVIIPGNSGCARAGDTMTLGADFVLANDVQAIGSSVASTVITNDLFADPDPKTVPNPKTITQGTPNGLAFDGTVTIGNAPVPDTENA